MSQEAERAPIPLAKGLVFILTETRTSNQGVATDTTPWSNQKSKQRLGRYIRTTNCMSYVVVLVLLCSLSDINCWRVSSIFLIRKNNLQVMAEGQVADPNKDNDYVGAKYGHLNTLQWLLRWWTSNSLHMQEILVFVLVHIFFISQYFWFSLCAICCLREFNEKRNCWRNKGNRLTKLCKVLKYRAYAYENILIVCPKY